MSKEEKRAPEVRFEGFHDDWKQRKLGDIADITKLAGFEFTKYVNYSDEGTIIALRGLNVKNGQLILDDVKYIDQSDFKKLSRSKLYKNDILFTYVGTVGELAVIPEDDKYYLAPNVARIRLVNGVCPQFISQMMSGSIFYKKVIFPLIATSSQPALSMENVRKFTFLLPILEEQIKISTFLNQLDDSIALHQEKLSKLQSLKKAALQSLFPQKNETEPKVRFANFTDRWSSYKIKDIFLERVEKNGEGELISVTINSGVVKASELDRKDNSSSNKTNYKRIKRHDIVYNSMRMWQGASGYSPYNGIVSPAYTVITPKPGINSKFFSFMFKKNEMIQNFKRNSQGLTSDTWNLKFPALSSIKVKVPKTEEQDKIEQYMTNLDSIIKLYQIKLENLQGIKKALLQKMFI
ncbi:hypothetical protein TEHN7125_2186 [Tetragenococcus halophilus subsp. halophilus]|uniref:restriction endonuclease subunit S n=1 Tax=Tetragenococcus halophilus TaxID=51669 RepID=UPI000CB952B1|nr:restriction endonuclease subunit S [Tetragenococcus halophilus]GBD74026.1 hypothetical protein TEHN7125_2186 [Tetragenococcus halophilus subsp. halophilus]